MKENKKSYNTVKTDVLIYIMGGIGILFALGGFGVGGLIGTIMLFVIPMFLCVMFMIFKHPVYGILYTILFIYNRSNIFFEFDGWWITYIPVMALAIFFVDVVYRSYAKWKEKKCMKDKGTDSLPNEIESV